MENETEKGMDMRISGAHVRVCNTEGIHSGY